ncbi:hypothetical protein [Adhaeribacter terreus]|uniref:Uncharacterized protein n=1 Tax=Adhaeribacter terreus TaxID=529703 RepID=A0ABW0ED08_9BACT
MEKVYALLLLVLCCFSPAKAQQLEGANWFFGGWAQTSIPGVHLDFKGQKPVAVPYNSDFSLGAGVATISDKNGQLLFFSNSGVVFTRQIQNNKYLEMPNGKVFQTEDFTTSELITQSPVDPQVYYVFIVRGNWAQGNRKLYVVQIDMRLNNGFGDVVPNSFQLLKREVGPGLAAMLHANNRDTWIVSYINTTDSVQAYLVNPTGISPPVISTTGKVLSHEGRIKSSANSALLAAVGLQQIEVFQFNRSTGAVSSLHSLILPNPTKQTGWAFAFSPDNTKLYAGTRKPSPSPSNAMYSIVQYDLAAGNTAQIQLSLNTIYNPGSSENGSIIMDMQLAIDGKIYVSRLDSLRHLSILTCPDNYGTASNFILRGVDALQKYFGNGTTLPALNQTIFRNAGILQAQAFRDTICYGDSVQLSAYGAGAEHFQWQVANGLTAV